MTKVKPFKGVVYNQEGAGVISRLICPPYDIISPAQQERYHQQDAHNFIHILLPRGFPGEDKYRRAATNFAAWQKEKILIPDKSPAIYFYSQQYRFKGETRVRLGFIALLELDTKNSSVFAHEQTRRAPKEDRLRLLKRVKANLSPIFVVFGDKKRIIQHTWQHIKDQMPFIDAIDNDKVVHKVWRLDDPVMVADIQAKMQGENIFIADGHHRYEVACMYRDAMKEKIPEATQDASFNYIMAYFTNTGAGGLMILPVHRLLALPARPSCEVLLSKLAEYFEVEPVKDKARFFFLMEKGGRTEHLLGMYIDKRFWLLRLKNVKILERLIIGKPPEYQRLDVSVLNYLVLQRILGFDADDKECISYSPDAEEVIAEVDAAPDARIAFFLNPVRVEQLTAVALTGNKMPPKSTYFYPKVASGLVIHKFDPEAKNIF